MTEAGNQKSEVRTPPGVVAVLTNPKGVVVASYADFERSRMGLGNLYEAQAYRARRLLIQDFMCGMCGPELARALAGYAAEQAVNRLCREDGWMLTLIPVGHEGEEIERA